MTPYEEAQARIRHAKATKAEILDLGDLQLKTLPPELGELAALRVLALGVIRLATDESGQLSCSTDFKRSKQPLTDLTLLGRLPGLISLSLHQCVSLRDVSGLAGLPALTSLDLCGCGSLRDVSGLAGLPALTSLDLSWCHALTGIGGLTPLPVLTRLDLSFCDALTDLSGLVGLTALISLDLSGCGALTNVSGLANLPNLTTLGLQRCGYLGSFDPIQALLSSLEVLYLHGSTFDGLPVELYGDKLENVAPKVRAHFADLAYDPQDDTELKVFLLGNGGVGKSFLGNRLLPRERQADPATIASTHGIQVHEFPLDLDGVAEPARVNLWDFGGQEIYHGSHALFLQRRAVFLLLWTPDHEQGSCVEGGVTIRHRPLAYWLDYIRHVAGTDAPVIVVQSQVDRHGKRKPPVELPADFVSLETHAVSSTTGTGLNGLRGMLADAVTHLLTTPPRIGGGRVELRRQLREMASEKRLLTVPEFRDLCRANGKISDPDAVLSFFHECGVVFYHHEMFDGRIVLDQNWALDAIYTLLDRGKTLPLLNRHGRFTRDRLRELVWQDKDGAECDTLLGMMLSCGICFAVGGGEFVAPELLPAYSDALDPMLASLRNDPGYLGFTIDYPFLHDGILRDILSGLGREASDHAIYWKYGCWFHEAHRDCDVLVESVPGDPGGQVTVRAWGRDPASVLRNVHGTLAGHRLVVAPTTTFLNFDGFDERREEPAAPLTVGPPPVDARQVYLSYAWGEDTTELGRRREAAARCVIDRLTAEGYHVTYDKKDLRPGDLISAFIRRIGRADNVVAILSRKYLESEYCVKELYLAFCHHQQEPAEFRRAVLPVVLPDAGLLDDAALDGYLAHWRDRRERNNRRHGHNPAGRVLEDHQVGHWIAILPMVLGLLADKVSSPVGDDALDAMVDRVLAQLANRAGSPFPGFPGGAIRR